MAVVQYDLKQCPASWDFLQFLINSRLVYKNFDVAIKDGFRDDRLPKTKEQRRTLIDNVMRPALKLIGAHEAHSTKAKNISYLIRPAVDYANSGRSIPKWKIPNDVLDECSSYLNGRKPYVITLRECDYFVERNSNLEAWLQFAKTLDDVIFVRDTSKADEPLAFETCPRASKDLLFRAALMSMARCNFLVGNGPVLLAYYMDAPWLLFKSLTPELPDYKPGSAEWWETMGIPVGHQLPWANSDQRMIWKTDSLENIREAFKNLNLQELGHITTIPAMSDERRNENVKRNCGAIRKRVQDGIEPHDLVANLVCFGPSLAQTWPTLINKQDVYCVGAAHDFLVSKGIVPYASIDCDPRARVVDQITPHAAVRYWLASCVDPSYIRKLRGHDVALFHLHNGEISANHIWDLEPDAWLLVGGGSVGLRSVSLLYARGYRKFAIHGMDSSYDGAIEYAGSHVSQNEKRMMDIKCGNRWFKSNPSLVDYARQFISDLRLWKDASFEMHGDGLLQEMVKCSKSS